MYTFNQLIGQEDIIHHMQSAIQYKKVSHSYIIDGAEGMGKMTLAKAFVKTLQCLEKGIEPCNQCISCRAFESGNHPDIVYVQSTKKKSIGIDDIRDQIQKDIDIKPYQYAYKIYIINKANTLTVQAQNALLKTIEDPPNYAIIILLTDNANTFLPTILSRCILLKMRPLTEVMIKDYFMTVHHIPDYQAQLYAAFGQGNLGRAIQLFSSPKFLEMRDALLQVIEKLEYADTIETMKLVGELEPYKDHIQEILDMLYIWFRDLLVIKKVEDTNTIIQKDKVKSLLKHVNNLSYNRISQCLESIEKAKEQLQSNTNYQLTLEILLLNLKPTK